MNDKKRTVETIDDVVTNFLAAIKTCNQLATHILKHFPNGDEEAWFAIEREYGSLVADAFKDALHFPKHDGLVGRRAVLPEKSALLGRLGRIVNEWSLSDGKLVVVVRVVEPNIVCDTNEVLSGIELLEAGQQNVEEY